MEPVTQSNFNAFVSNDVAVLEFYADWCQPCKRLNPILKQIEKEYDATVGKVNVDDHPNIASLYSITSIPTTILFKDGKEVTRLTGAKPLADFVEAFNLTQKATV